MRVARSFALAYPDGPRDCEAVAVDAGEGMVYLLSKRDPLPQLYRVPLHPSTPLVVAEALGAIAIPRAAADAADPERINWVTSMDFDADLHRAAVVTLRVESVLGKHPRKVVEDSARVAGRAFSPWPDVNEETELGAGGICHQCSLIDRFWIADSYSDLNAVRRLLGRRGDSSGSCPF